MFELEVVVVIIGLRTETNLLHLLLLRVGFGFFLLFLLGVEEFLVIHYSAHRWHRCWSNLDEIEILVIGYFHSLLERVDTLLYIVADKAHLSHTFDFVVNTVWVFFNNSTAARSLRNSCYCFTY